MALSSFTGGSARWKLHKKKIAGHRNPIAPACKVVVEQMEQRLLFAIHWTGGSSGFWDDANNWDANRIPQFGDDVVIGSGTNVTVRTLTNRANTITSGGTLTVDTGGDVFVDSGATLTNLTVSGGTITLGATTVSGNI